MRKMKKINGFLVVRFNDREKRDYPTLGSFGVINAEDYTGDLDFDLDAMEYSDADRIEVAVEQARGLNAEEDFSDEPATDTVIAETADEAREEEVAPKVMALSWAERLKTQIKSKHYPDIDPRTAAHEPELSERTTFENLSGGLKNDPIVRKVYALGLVLVDAEERPTNDCRVYLDIFNMARELDDALDNVKPDGAPALALRGAIRDRLAELREMYFENYAVQQFKKGIQP